MNMLEIAPWEEVLVQNGAKHTRATSPGKPELEMVQEMYIHKLPVDSLSPALLQVFICCEPS